MATFLETVIFFNELGRGMERERERVGGGGGGGEGGIGGAPAKNG